MKGSIVQIIGPVVDVEFEGQPPAIYTALKTASPDKKVQSLVLEVAQHLGGGRVRAVSMGPTEGLKRGASVENTGAPISVPVGKETLGRMYNLLGEPIDNMPAPVNPKRLPIHRHAPKFTEQSTEVQIFERSE